MAFVDGAISMMQTGLDFVEEESPFKLAADAASLGGTALDMAVNGPSWSGAADMAAGGVTLGIDMLRENETVGAFESLLPGVGPLVGGLATTVGGLGGMYENADQIDQGYLSNDDGGRNEFWGSAGDATLGATHAMLGGLESAAIAADLAEAGSVIGLPLELLSLPATGVAIAADEGLSLAEAGVNAAGFATGLAGTALNQLQGLDGKDAHDWYFGAGDVVGLAEHALFDGGRAAIGAATDAFGHYAE